MRFLIPGAVLLLGVVSAFTDDEAVAMGSRQLPQSVATDTDPLSHANRLPPSLEQKVRFLRADL